MTIFYNICLQLFESLYQILDFLKNTFTSH